MQVDLRADIVALKCFFNFFEEVVPADYKLNWVLQGVEYLAQGVFERPCQADYAV